MDLRCDEAGVADGQLGRKMHTAPKSDSLGWDLALTPIHSEALGMLLWFSGSPFPHP